MREDLLEYLCSKDTETIKVGIELIIQTETTEEVSEYLNYCYEDNETNHKAYGCFVDRLEGDKDFVCHFSMQGDIVKRRTYEPTNP